MKQANAANNMATHAQKKLGEQSRGLVPPKTTSTLAFDY